MKKIFKFMTAALAVFALASCSDEINLEKATQQEKQAALQNADLIGRLNNGEATRVGIEETQFSNGKLVDYELRWTEGDQVRVFKLDDMNYNTYTLDPATAGETEGAFSKTADFKPIYGGDIYAMTEGQFVYAVSPDQNGDPLLTMTIPASYDLDEDYLEAAHINKFPAPFWGKATVAEEGTNSVTGEPNYQLTAGFDGLTAFLRIDARSLPYGTKAIVLTTHGARTSHMPTDSESELEGFQLTTADAFTQAYAAPAAATRANWLAWYNSGNDFIDGGKSEPLSGALSTVLKPGAALAYSDLLVSKDTIRVNLQNVPELFDTGYGVIDQSTTYPTPGYIDWEHWQWVPGQQGSTDGSLTPINVDQNRDKVIYIPIVAGLYKNLHVIAVTDDSPFSYQWIGEEIQVYNDETFKVGTIKQLIMKVDVQLPADCDTWKELSDELVRQAALNPGRTLNIDIPEAIAEQPEGGQLWIDNQKLNNDVILNWPNTGLEANLSIIEEQAVLNSDGSVTWLQTIVENPSAAERYITLNLDPDQTGTINFVTPTSIVTIGTTTGFNNTGATVNVLAASHNDMVPNSTLNDPTVYPGVSGHDLVANNNGGLMNRKNATIFVKNGIYALNVMPDSKGDVYIYSAGFEETEISGYLAIRTYQPMKTRLTDALVYNIWAVNSSDAEDVSNKRYVFTTGSSAIGLIQTLASQWDLVTVAAPATAASQIPTSTDPTKLLPEAYTPKNFHVVAYWTGAALQPGAVERYDKALVYTAAQLASVGEKTTADYAIPAGVVSEMWLGGDDYPWIGAEVIVPEFKFDGMRVSLQNMELEINDNTFTDPHHCCTSCGELRKISLEKNLGLFRSIISSTSVELDSINLNDVMLTTDKPINNIGSIAGLIASPDVTMTKNHVGEVKIDVNGTNIGGMVGLLEGDENGNYAKLTMRENKVTSKDDDKDSGWIISDKDNVGGQIGYAIVNDATIKKSVVSLIHEITAGKRNIGTKASPDYVSRVGGIVGLMDALTSVVIDSTDVYVGEKIEGEKMQVGGIAGYINALKEGAPVSITKSKVNTPLIESTDGGRVGGIAGQLDDKGSTVTGNTVTGKAIKASGANTKTNGDFLDGYVGGVAGRLYDTATDADFSGNTVNVTDEISTPQQYAGGEIGFSRMSDPAAILNIKSASVTTKLLKAVEGFAGGEIGEQYDGRVNIGEYATDAQLNTAISVDKLSGAYALGGLVGDNNDPLFVYTNHKGNPKTAWSDVNIGIKDWETEKPLSYYDADNETDHRSGTMGNILGYLDQTLTVQETATDMHVADKLTSDKKKALFFNNHKNRKHTTGESADYWGDTNGYVGWGHSGNYIINGEGMNGDQTGYYNLYKNDIEKDTDGKTVYDKTKSRWE